MKTARAQILRIAIAGCITLLAWGCSSTKHVPEGRYLLDKVHIEIEPGSDVSSSELNNYLRQSPNHKVLGFLRLQLATYSLSGRDSTKALNKWLRRIGQPPVIYDEALTEASARQLALAMVNRGYMDASVSVDTARSGSKKMEVTYRVTPGRPHRISAVDINIPDTAIARLVMADTVRYTPHAGELLDRTHLDEVRTRIAEHLRDNGYYAFTKDYITFTADTVAGRSDVELAMHLRAPLGEGNRPDTTRRHVPYVIRHVYFVPSFTPGETIEQIHRNTVDSVNYRGITVLYGPDRYISPGILDEKCFLTPGSIFRQSDIDRTYEALSRLSILKSVNITPVAVSVDNNQGELDFYVLMQRHRKQSLTFELEGTNSEGDLGVGGSVTYQHRNLGHRSEMLTAKVRANYESLSGKFDGLINNRYTEYAGEVGLTLPKFQFPFLSRAYKRRIKATTEFSTSFNYQERPEYTRIIAGAAWKYKWGDRSNTTRRTLDLIDVNYVYLPKSTIDFIDQISPDNPLLRYSYEDHFIMRLGYTYLHTNRRAPSTALGAKILQDAIFTFRASVETAGNILYGISHIIGQHRDDGVYKVLGVPYSQYVKGEIDYSYTRNFSTRHSVAFHVAAGLGYPYGNSKMIPFEKRFYAGGANGVRGWAVRTLGPGSYDARNQVTSFINQCGDISMLMSAEYRAKLFWVIEAGVFVDAGNIWTIKNYENQPGGLFSFKTFWKEIAWAYGIGIRLDFTYFLFRLDLGMKAYNPARNQERWPLAHPNWGRDHTIHFTVGYPF